MTLLHADAVTCDSAGMSLFDELTAARSAILKPHLDGPPKIVTLLRRPLDDMSQVFRIERWEAGGGLAEPIDARNVLMDRMPEQFIAEDQVLGPLIVAGVRKRGELYVELMVAPASE